MSAKKNKNASEEWKETHAPNCAVNHVGSSGAMERDGAIEIFTCSIEKHNLCYTTYGGDGDSSSYAAVKKATEDKYGDYPLVKEDCVGHVQKRMGSALRSYKNGGRGTKLSNGKGVVGTGWLTDAVVDHMQTYHGYAIRNNKGNTTEITNVIWPIYYHMLAGPPDETAEYQHKYCPKTETTWCMYQKDIINKTNFYNSYKCLPSIFRVELESIFTCLSSQQLMESCQRGLTQNQNESLNNMVWSPCPKRVFCVVLRYKTAVCNSIVPWNQGARGTKNLFQKLKLTVSSNSITGFQHQDRVRLYQSTNRIMKKYDKRSQQLGQSRKKE